MTARKVIIDCDPGQDDAVALFLAMSSPDELDILGVTTVAGNVPLELTQRNARMMCDIAGLTDLPVYAGCERPMVLEPITAEYIHGNTGIDGVDVFEPATPLQQGDAVDFIIDTLLAADKGTVTLIPTGPMTNVATAIQREPAILDSVQQSLAIGRIQYPC
jgi:purine nucleosidase